MSHHINKRKQSGVALFMTLLVVSIATLLATEIWFNNILDVSRSASNRALYQSDHYAKGMALWAADALRQDFEQDSSYDSRSDPWNRPIAGLELEDAVLSGQLSDMDGKFNLNNLLLNGQIDNQSHEFFLRILSNLEMDVALADKIIDWMDGDQVPRPMGVEDNFYLSRPEPYRTSGQHLSHMSELKLIDGITESVYQRLKAHVTVLPITTNQPTKLNVNTASTLLLLSLETRMTQKEALALYNDGYAAYKSLEDFFKQPAIRVYRLEDPSKQMNRILKTTSQWFQAQVDIKMSDVIFRKFALLHRISTQTLVRQWSLTPYL